MAAKSKDPKAIIAEAAENPAPAPDMRRPKATDAAKAGSYLDVKPLPEDCPVIPLGHLAGVNYVLDHAGQLRPLSSDCRKGEIMQLFGHVGIPWLIEEYPQWAEGKKGEGPYKKGFDQTKVQEALIAACSRKGLFNPTGRTRGRGAHAGTHGELILHCGDHVLIGGAVTTTGKAKKVEEHSTGLFGRFVYPSDEPINPPAREPAARELGRDLLTLFRKWKWQDPIAPMLLTGFVVAAPFGGGLPWRPHMWIVGPSGAGKSTLQLLINRLLGDWALATDDATEAGLRQTLNQDTLPVLFDEFEPSDTNHQVMDKVVRLARGASEGKKGALRGGADHKAAKFIARSCFLFSSIQYQAMEAQDRNRMAIVTLSKIPPKSAKPDIPNNLEQQGDMLRRRVLEQWHRFAPTLAAYQKTMFEQGFSPREQDTYGVLLACADMALHDDTPDPICLAEESYRVRELVEMLGPSLDSSRGDAEDNATRCLRTLASHRLPAKSGQDQEQVATWIGKAFVDVVNGRTNGSPAFAKLLNHGIALVHPPDDPKSESAGPRAYIDDAKKPVHVAIAGKDHAGIAEIFSRTPVWAGGMWAQTLATIPGARASKNAKMGAKTRATTVPIEAFIDMADWREEAAAAMARMVGAGE